MSNPKDSNNNNNLLERIAEDAKYSLANLHGKGIEKNLEKAFYWYQRAAENGNKFAMNGLAICYKNGEGTEKSLEKASYWSQKLAKCDHMKEQKDIKEQ